MTDEVAVELIEGIARLRRWMLVGCIVRCLSVMAITLPILWLVYACYVML